MKISPASRLKAKTISVGAIDCDSTGFVLLLNGIATGFSIDQRLGREVLMEAVHVRVAASVTASTGTDQLQRWMIVYDKQSNGAALTVTDVLDSAHPSSPLNLANIARFSIIADHEYTLNASAEPGSKKFFDVELPLRRRSIFNAGTAGTVADISTGSLYLITVGTNPAGVTAGQLQLSTRVVFHNII